MVNSTFSQNPINVLLVEDDAGSRQLVRRALHDHNSSVRYDISEAEDLASACQMLNERNFDNVILDLQLPDSSGLDTLRSIKNADPDVPVVVLSGISDHETAINSIKYGADYYIVKGDMLREMLGRSICYSIERKRRLSESANPDNLQSHVDLLQYQIREVKESLSDQIHSKNHAEWSMRKLSEEHEMLLDILPAMIWQIDKSGMIVRLNKPAANLIDKSTDEVIGKDFYHLFAGNDNQTRMKHENIFNNGVALNEDVEAYKSTSDSLEYLTTEVVPHRDESGYICGLVIMAKNAPNNGKTSQPETARKALKEKFAPESPFMSRKVGAVRVEKNETPQKQYSGKVLVVDDDSLNRILIGSHIKDSGVDVDFASNGPAAIEKTLAEDYDLVLTALQMPEMDGLEVAKNLRQTDFEPPILIMSAFYPEDTLDKIEESGCNDYISKPLNKKDIFSVFDNFLQVTAGVE
jgi:DNA-binding response OmpR family regulator